MENYELILMLAIGLALCLFGYKIKKIAFFILWFLIGYQLMSYLMPVLNNAVPQIATMTIWQTLLPIAGGILLGLLGFSIEKLCIGGACFGLTIILATKYFGTAPETIAIAAVVGIVLAGLATMLIKPASIVATSLAGAYLLILAGTELLPDLNFTTYYFAYLAGLGAVGSLFQFITTKHSA